MIAFVVFSLVGLGTVSYISDNLFVGNPFLTDTRIID